MGWNWVGSLRQPDAIHGDFRKIIRTGIGPQQVSKYFPLIESETKKFLHHLKTYNGDVMHALTEYVAFIALLSALTMSQLHRRYSHSNHIREAAVEPAWKRARFSQCGGNDSLSGCNGPDLASEFLSLL